MHSAHSPINLVAVKNTESCTEASIRCQLFNPDSSWVTKLLLSVIASVVEDCQLASWTVMIINRNPLKLLGIKEGAKLAWTGFESQLSSFLPCTRSCR